MLVVALALATAACSDSTPAGTTSSAATGAEPTTTSDPPRTTTSTAQPPPTAATTTVAPPGTTTSSISPAADLQVRLEEVVQVDQPVLVVSFPEDPRLLVVDKPGRIWVVEAGEREVVLDIRDLVTSGGERGLLGLAFHPDFASNRLFYVNYTDRSGDTIIAEYLMGDGDTADAGTGRVVLRVRQPATNHNGGMIAFGEDGLLYIGMGDGGGANNQYRTARNPNRLNGAMLRIVVGPEAPEPYGVPADNPYVEKEEGRDEVWAIGLRNPWRFTIDGERLYVADVGQGRIEEISVVSTSDPGPDFGWSVMEGDECFRSSDCDASEFVAPVFTYGHGQGCSISGGVVYRGSELPEISGHYFFADYCSGWVRSIALDESGALVQELEWPDLELRLPTGFGTDAAGEMYIASQAGPVYKVVRDEDG